MGRHKNNVSKAKEEGFELTVQQLKDWNVKYHELIMGKPSYDVIIDDKAYNYDDNWIEPYYIERFYQIADEYRSEEVGYNLKIIALHMDAFYTNSDNYNIPVLEALRVVSLVQDGDKKTANRRLLRLQQKYNE